MFKKLNKDNKLAKGFTIIEVMIVLAIAGLIMVVVLVAVPQLQRSQRNTATRAVADRVFTELQNFASNNNGNYPSTVGTQRADFCGRYLQRVVGAVNDCTNVTTATGASFIHDSRTGTPVGIAFNANATAAIDSVGGVARTLVVHMNTTTGYRCAGESVIAGNGARQVALTLFLEGGSIVCRDNQ